MPQDQNPEPEDPGDRHPWDRRPDESPRAHLAFRAFLDLGEGRTILAAYRQARGKPDAAQADGTWNGWCSEFSWLARAACFDDHRRRERDKAAVREAARQAALWERRRHLALEDSYELAQLLKRKARLALSLPLARRKVSRDGTVVIMPSPRWTVAAATRAALVGVEIEQAVLAAVSRPIEECTPEELEAIAGASPPVPPVGPARTLNGPPPASD